MMNIGSHEYYMQMALRQAQRALEDNEVPIGCVIIRYDPENPGAPGQLIGSACNQVERLKDPTAHAETIAITQAASAVGDWRLTHTVLYVTKEPCAMCAGAIILARIPTVVYGIRDPQRGGAESVFNILCHPQLNHRCEIVSGILEPECKAMLKGFFEKKRQTS